MSTAYLELTAFDPIVARDGRPFGVGQGNRMRGLPWPFPSVVAGSFRTALVKATGGDFTGTTPTELMKLAVAGVLPVGERDLYLPAPHDCVWDEKKGDIHRAAPITFEVGEGCDFPCELRPVVHAAGEDFKAKSAPPWWPVRKYVGWLTDARTKYDSNFFTTGFLDEPRLEERTQVEMNAEAGSVEEGKLFTTAGLRLAHLPRFGVPPEEERFDKTFMPITLTARVETGDRDASRLGLYPLGGERRLAHWKTGGDPDLWQCPPEVTRALGKTKNVRMVLATPAVFEHGWRPGWIDGTTLTGSPPDSAAKLKLVGVSIPRWRVSGWSLAEPRGPKPIKRLVPAGGVYFFEVVESDNASSLAGRWLQPVSDGTQDRLDGFGLAVWGTW